VIDHVLIMDRGRILCDSPFDDLREKYVRVNLTSLSGPLPEHLALPNIVESRRNETQATLTVRDLTPAQIDSAAVAMNCQADLQPLPLEDLYRLVMERK
jgi:ABC-type multidrug transport system ATPase subunit